MKDKKDLVIVALPTFCLTAILFMILPIKSNPAEYDPCVDLNDDGNIDILDAIILASHFDTSGTPINKTALLLGGGQAKTLRFYEPNETVTYSEDTFMDAAVFVWTPSNSANNAILSINCYFQYRSEYGLLFRVTINGNDAVDHGEYESPEYQWSPVHTLSEWYTNCAPNQNTYTVRFQIAAGNPSYAAYVKDINVILTVIDGMPPSN